MNKPILVYSNKCKFSYQFVNELSDYGILKNVDMVCIEKERKKIPQGVSRVPSIVLDNNVLTGEHAFLWFKTVKESKKAEEPKVEAKSVETPRKVRFAPESETSEQDNVMGIEGNTGSSFSMLDESIEPHNFHQYEMLNIESDSVISKHTKELIPDKLPDKQKEMASAYEKLMEQRKQELSNIPKSA